MVKSLTSRSVLDRVKPLEVVLELVSFSGGENTIGEDHELETNECRLSENWEATSIGGMIRDKGFTQVSKGANKTITAVFTGSGLDDATSGGTFTDTTTVTFTVEIDATGTPDTFKWKKGTGAWTTGVSITGSAQDLSDGVTVTFAATTGHTLADSWAIECIAYSSGLDFLMHHYEGNSTELYGVIEGDLVIKNSSALDQEDADAFTSGTKCGGVSAGNKLYVTNKTDGIKVKEIGVAITTQTTSPTNECERMSEMNSRLIAEGDDNKNVYGSVVGSGNWDGAGGWTTSNNAWSMTMPDLTQGHMEGFPSGTDLTVFTEFDTYVIYNQPNVARRRIQNGIGCGIPDSIARGNEGLFFFSTYPTRGIFLWDGVSFTNLTEKHDFIEDVDLTKEASGIYRDRKYYFSYNETGSGVTYPNRTKIFDTRFGRWKTKTINPSVGAGWGGAWGGAWGGEDTDDNFGVMALATRDDNELYVGSSRKANLYELDDSSTSDNGQDTIAKYVTKTFTSRDFNVASGGGMPIDFARIKLLKTAIVNRGLDGKIIISWTSDRDKHTGSQVFDLQGVSGDKINDGFTLNSSKVISTSDITDKTQQKTFNNSAVGREFQFEITTQGTDSVRTEIKRIKIHAIILDEL